MGSMQSIMGMMPGMNNVAVPDDADKQMKRTEAIIYSMTKQERRTPRLLNGNRRQRIAKGAGVKIVEVNQLMKQFQQMQENDEDDEWRRFEKDASSDGSHAGCSRWCGWRRAVAFRVYPACSTGLAHFTSGHFSENHDCLLSARESFRGTVVRLPRNGVLCRPTSNLSHRPIVSLYSLSPLVLTSGLNNSSMLFPNVSARAKARVNEGSCLPVSIAFTAWRDTPNFSARAAW